MLGQIPECFGPYFTKGETWNNQLDLIPPTIFCKKKP